MKNIDVLLLNLPTGSWYKDKLADSNSMPPLGLLYIATYLQNNNYEVCVKDYAVESLTVDELRNLLIDAKPKVVGMTTYNESWNVQKMLCGVMKEIAPETIIIAGGAFSTFCYEDVLNQTETDYVSRGEGEYSILQLCNQLLRENKKKEEISVPGVCYKKENGEIVANTQISRIMDLDNIPFPNRDLIPLDKYIMPFTICTSRGCPGNCIFCSSKAFWGREVIMRSAKNVFDEVIEIHDKYGANIFYIADDTFTASKKRCEDFCKMIGESGINFVWGCESRADIVTEEFIKMLKEAGCQKIQFGLESANNEILNKLKKNVTIEEIEYAVKCAAKYGMHIQTSYIIGHAFDTEETVKETIAFANYLRETYGARVVCSVNTPFPGTEQYERREELGIKLYTDEWQRFVLNNPIIRTNNLTINQLRYYLGKGQELVR